MCVPGGQQTQKTYRTLPFRTVELCTTDSFGADGKTSITSQRNLAHTTQAANVRHHVRLFGKTAKDNGTNYFKYLNFPKVNQVELKDLKCESSFSEATSFTFSLFDERKMNL